MDVTRPRLGWNEIGIQKTELSFRTIAESEGDGEL